MAKRLIVGTAILAPLCACELSTSGLLDVERTSGTDAGATVDGRHDASVGYDAAAPPLDAAADSRGDAAEASVTPDAARDATPDVGEGSVDAGVPCAEFAAVRALGHCYIPLAALTSWDDAREACEALKPRAHLVVINSAEEQTVVQGVGLLDRWIGLRRPDDSNGTDKASFTWVDGTPRGYENWNGGEPDNSGACVRLRGDPVAFGRWADRACDPTIGLSGVCERE